MRLTYVIYVYACALFYTLITISPKPYVNHKVIWSDNTMRLTYVIYVNAEEAILYFDATKPQP